MTKTAVEAFNMLELHDLESLPEVKGRDVAIAMKNCAEMLQDIRNLIQIDLKLKIEIDWE